MLHGLLTLCLFSAAIAPAASAQPSGTRVVVVRAEARGRAEALAIELARALGSRGIPAALPPAPASIPDGADALTDAEHAYDMLRHGEAAGALDALIGAVDTGRVRLERDRLVRALLVLALARSALGAGGEADAAIDRALAIDPTLAPDPARYPPTLRDRIEARRPGGASAAIHVEVDPPDATIEIDGREASAGARVVPGRHLVAARRAGRLTATRAIDVPPSGAELELVLAPDAGAILGAPGLPGDAITPELERAAHEVGGALLLVDLLPTALVARDGERRARVELAEGEPSSAAADALVAALLRPEDRADPVPWIVGSVGAAIAVAVAIGVGVAVASQAPSGFDAIGSR